MLGVDKVARLLEKNVIEIAPLAYMRGRTLNDAFVILDEAQNTSIEQMKMFLTRLGFGSTAVITGDMTQVDLPKHQKSGLKDAMEVLRGVDGVQLHLLRIARRGAPSAGRAHRERLRGARCQDAAERRKLIAYGRNIDA